MLGLVCSRLDWFIYVHCGCESFYMRPRQQITELFSTFLQFEADYADRWAVDARLRHQMKQCLDRIAETATSEKFWVAYWYRLWQESVQPPVRPDLHLAAYLQEPCYWASQQTVRKFADSQYGLSDCFQIAIIEVGAVLKGFKPDRGASLKTYASMAFTSLLRDALRQRQVVDLCSDWALLRRISKKRLLEALSYGGIIASALPQYQLAWTCFKTLYLPAAPAGKLPKPDLAFWESVAQLYNAERQQLLIRSSVDALTLERWLIQIAQWIRSYLYPSVGSLNARRFAEDTLEIQDTLTDHSDSLLSEWVMQEEVEDRDKQRLQLNQTLSDAVSKLDGQSQDILRLYYQQGLTQQQIMRELTLSQASVSRRLSKAREHLLTTTVQWSQALNIGITPTLIKEMSTALDEWLNARYQPNGAAPST